MHVCSRDITGFSLLHCSVIFNNVKIVSSLVNSGSLGVTCFHMTPLNLALMLHFLPRLKRKIELCREEYEQIGRNDPLFIKTNRLWIEKNHRAYLILDPQAPVAQKIADEVVFRSFQGEGVEFF